MKSNSSFNLTKKQISKIINKKIGLSQLYSDKILDDLIFTLKEIIKKEDLTIKNFGIFKIKNKNERIGRNPKNKIKYKIKARKVLSFIMSKNLDIN